MVMEWLQQLVGVLMELSEGKAEDQWLVFIPLAAKVDLDWSLVSHQGQFVHVAAGIV